MHFIHFAEVCVQNIEFHHIVHFKLRLWNLGVIEPWGEMSPEEFTALYISSCVMSSLASIIFRRSIKSSGISLGAVSITNVFFRKIDLQIIMYKKNNVKFIVFLVWCYIICSWIFCSVSPKRKIRCDIFTSHTVWCNLCKLKNIYSM